MARSTVKDLTVGSPLKLIIGFTTPLLFGYVFQQLYNFVDTAIVGKYLGSEALAAVGSTGSLNFLILGFVMGSCSGFAIPVAQAFGAKDETEVRRNVMHCVYCAGSISIIIGVLTGLLCPWMLRITNTPPEIIANAQAYIQPILLAIPVTALYNMAGGIMRSLGDSKTPVYFLTMASLVNIVLDLVLILVFDMGVAGAAIATIISQLASGVGCLIVLMKRFPILRMSKDDMVFRPEYAKRLVGMGMPMGLQFSITAIGGLVVQTAVNGLGTVYVAAVTAGAKLNNFFSCIFDALASTMATFAGQNVGARKVERVHQGLKAAAVVGCVYCALCLAAVLLFAPNLLSIFVDGSDTLVIGYAQQYLVVNVSCYVALLLVNIVRLTIQGLGFTRVAMIAGALEMVARSGVAVLLVPIFGFSGACWANPMAWLFADAFLIPCYFHVMKKLQHRLYPAGHNA